MRKKLLITIAVVAALAALGLTAHLLDFASLASRVHGG
jgi:hypothetical protein